MVVVVVVFCLSAMFVTVACFSVFTLHKNMACKVKTIQVFFFFWLFFLQKNMHTKNSWNVDNVKRGMNL